jgi:hypothetical protein
MPEVVASLPSLTSMSTWCPELDDLSLLEGRELAACSCILAGALYLTLSGPADLPFPSYLLRCDPSCPSWSLACIVFGWTKSAFLTPRTAGSYDSAPQQPREFHKTLPLFTSRSICVGTTQTVGGSTSWFPNGKVLPEKPAPWTALIARQGLGF